MNELKYDVFISYKTEESEFAREVSKALSENYNVFFAEKTLHEIGSDYFENDIKEALRESLVLLNVGMSKECLSGEWLKKERDYFIPLRDSSNKKRKIFNIVHNEFDIKNDLPKDLKNVNTRTFPGQKDEILGLIQNTKENNISIIADYTLTNVPNELETPYVKDVFRETSFSILQEYFTGLDENAGMMYVYGPAGVGKTSFMIRSFLAYENYMCKKYLYQVKGSNSTEEYLDEISEALGENFSSIARSNQLNIEFKDILNLSNASSKIDKLLRTYSKYIYTTTKINFILFVDAVDTINNAEDFMRTLVKNYQGIHFVFSGRKAPSDDLIVNLNDNRYLDIFKQNEHIGLELENLNSKLTLEYISSNLDRDKVLSNREWGIVSKKILEKSKGLPKYFEVLLANVNKIIASENKTVFDEILMEIDQAPGELNEYYKRIFNTIQKSNPLAMKILQILYWNNNTGIKIETLIVLLEEKPKIIYQALETITYLIKRDEENATVMINHLSISEALFDFYARDVHKNLTAQHLDSEYMQKVFEKDPILLYLAKYNTSIYTLLSSVYYFHEANILYLSLKSIVTFYIEKMLKKNENPIDLYFTYSKILFTQHMLKQNILKNGTSATDLFTTSDINLDKIYHFNEKVYRQYSEYEFEDVYNLRRLVLMSILDQNSYYQAKYLKKYFIYKYSAKYKKIFSNNRLSKLDLEGLNSHLSRTYVAMRYKMSGKEIDPKLGIYEDSVLVMLYDETNGKNLEAKVFNTIKLAQMQRHNKNFIDKQERYYSIIRTSSSVKLKKHFYNSIYYYCKTHDRLDAKIKDFLSDVAVDILLTNIHKFNKEDNHYRFLPSEKKQTINRILTYYRNYYEHGLESLLEDENKEYFIRMASFIKDGDIGEFLNYVNSCCTENNDIFRECVYEVIRNSDNESILMMCLEYIREYTGIVGDTPLMIMLLVFYKLGDIENLKELEKFVIQQESSKEERGIINKLVGSIDNSLDLHWDILNQRRITNLKNDLKDYIRKANYELRELEYFKEYMFTDDETYNERIYDAMIQSSYNIIDIEKMKFLFLFLRKYGLFNSEDEKVFALNIKFITNMDSFITSIRTFDHDFQMDFFDKVSSPEKDRIVFGDSLFSYFLELFNAYPITEKEVRLLGGCYYNKSFYEFAVKNLKIIQSLYDKIPVNGNENELNFKSMLYRNILAIKGEEAYKELEGQAWLTEEMKSNIASSLVFLTKNRETALYLMHFLPSGNERLLDHVKILVYIGVVFNDNGILEEGIGKLMLYKETIPKHRKISGYDNYLNFTLAHNLPENINKLISNIFTAYNFDHYHLNHFIHAEIFLSTGIYSPLLVRHAGNFTSFYTLFSELDKKLELDDYEGVLFNKDFDKYMMVLYDLYKEAELQGNEEKYDYYSALFNKLKQTYSTEFNKRFEDLSSVTLDTYYNEVKSSEDVFSLESMKHDYKVFYDFIKELIDKADEASMTMFNNIINEIKESEEYFNIVREASSISQKLQMKAVNIEKFEPIN